MSQYRNIPVVNVIDAVQLTTETWPEVCDLLGLEFFKQIGAGVCLIDPATGHPGAEGCSNEIGLTIPAFGLIAVARANDWVIKDARGDVSFLAPDVFAAEYEPVEQPA
jgi:hypothetical protein